ncbi:hypothetical protein MB02_10300 [Croceicoccus estronivorus]|uniref:hypothetical protein n=1 Tax=Croceicoccus estronivorus TaxID=1172626 RepID=UPI00082AABDD|nr:hypothetical protein [Croceicoccus estronivorus]OCC23562.1 hypothetical protein MB02_10300 [Croceicoccus estronivorus]
MTRLQKILLAASAVPFVSASPAMAESEEEKIIRFAAECTYVTKTVEKEGIGLKHSGDEWLGMLSQVEQKAGIDALPYLNQAKAKYNRHAKKMGADWAFKRMISRARECDKQL